MLLDIRTAALDDTIENRVHLAVPQLAAYKLRARVTPWNGTRCHLLVASPASPRDLVEQSQMDLDREDVNACLWAWATADLLVTASNQDVRGKRGRFRKRRVQHHLVKHRAAFRAGEVDPAYHSPAGRLLQ